MEIRENCVNSIRFSPFYLPSWEKSFILLLACPHWEIISESVICDQYEENREEHNRSGIKLRNGNWNSFRMWK